MYPIPRQQSGLLLHLSPHVRGAAAALAGDRLESAVDGQAVLE